MDLVHWLMVLLVVSVPWCICVGVWRLVGRLGAWRILGDDRVTQESRPGNVTSSQAHADSSGGAVETMFGAVKPPGAVVAP